MDSENWQDKLLSNPKLQEFCQLIDQGQTLVIEEISEAVCAYLLSLAQKNSNKHLVILSTRGHENKLFEDLSSFFPGRVVDYPAWETLPGENIAPSPDVVGERYKLLQQICDSKEPRVIVTTLAAILQKVISRDSLDCLHLHLKKGQSFSFEKLKENLVAMGYHPHPTASDKGEFAVRGGIIDCFCVNQPRPFRFEFFDDEIASIRTYDPISQTTTEKVTEAMISPAQELEMVTQEEKPATIFDYLGNQTLFVWEDLVALEDKYVALKAMTQFSSTFITFETLCEETKNLQKIYLSPESLDVLSNRCLPAKEKNQITFEFFSQTLTATRWHSPFLSIEQGLCPPGIELANLSNSEFFELLEKIVQEQPIDLRICYSKESEIEPFKEMDHLKFEKGYLSSGFYLHTPSFALISFAELTGRFKLRRQKQRSYSHQANSEFFELSAGEHVVHMQNGVGRYLGVEKRTNHLGVETEYMLLQYAEGGMLYVPMEQAGQISKYIGADESAPTLHNLGSNRWMRMREKTEAAIGNYAHDLLKLQAERSTLTKEPYPANSDLTQQFGQEFAYELTEDQQKAVELLETRMCSDQLMEALVLGDVGYGKTEVAMRAAFKTVVDGGKQVAVLVPTTVLAMQHYESFCQRMAGFPIKVDIVSRFRKPKQIKETLQKTSEGQVDILIGTHRLVSKDVDFKDLGLIVIDEEQRFGVRTKEHLKKFKTRVNCLTLSATPIPRTLYFSLIGVRDLALINTPPQDRLPIQSIVSQGSDAVLKTALMRELARDGQAYVIHNRVETIYQFAERIRKLVPASRIVVGHGQLSAAEIDAAFHAFKSGEANVLVATSIIENGIDIANANTILIDRADRFGLSDLYQMRGRVGRWNKKAYCYFMVPNPSTLNDISRKRLHSLLSASGPGSGMKIAMHDLEIRGAGNILGTEQSGHVATVGFHLYCKMLKKAMANLSKKQKPFSQTDVKMELPFDARLPEEYLNDTTLRMQFYQRIGDLSEADEIKGLFDEIEDRFGPLPQQALWLKHISYVRLFASNNHFVHLKLTPLVLIAEQEHGKKNKISKKILFKTPKTPEEVEKNVIEALTANFPTKKNASYTEV